DEEHGFGKRDHQHQRRDDDGEEGEGAKEVEGCAMVQLTATNGVAATSSAPQKLRRVAKAMSAPRAKPQMVNLIWSDTDALTISPVQIGGPVTSVWMSALS